MHRGVDHTMLHYGSKYLKMPHITLKYLEMSLNYLNWLRMASNVYLHICGILKFSYKAPGIETMINLDEIHP